MSNQNILIITSNRDNLQLFEGVLSGEGFNILRAKDSHSGLNIAIEMRPELILMDEGEFDRNGQKTLEQLRGEQIHTYVIICPVAHNFTSTLIRFIQV